MCPRILIVLLFGTVCFECAILTGKAFFCRDPDTGKLHAVNTTWASISFCGNYTCKLRKRNHTSSVPLRLFNITNVKKIANKTISAGTLQNNPVLNKNNELNRTDSENQLTYYENKIISKTRKDLSEQDNKASYTNLNRNIEAKSQTPANLLKDLLTQPERKDDQDVDNKYLTEDEIKAISEILRTVKRSDLLAIVDMYHLAQDIYKEIDSVLDDVVKEQIATTIAGTEEKKPKPISYWYDSLAGKGKLDVEPLGVKEVLTTVAADTNEIPPVSSKELSKLSLYYPISEFQRTSTYNHAPKNNPESTKAKESSKLLKETVKQRAYHQKKEIQPSYLLPYPFTYVNQYNLTDLPTFYNNPSWRVDYYNRYRYYQPYYNAFVAQIPNIVYSDEVQGIEQRSVNQNELESLKKKPEWKTDPIPREDIEEIRANVDTSKVLSFPLRKLVKLDTVGKLSKMTVSEESYRSKRSTEYDYKYSLNIDLNEEDEGEGVYETYLEKITCTPQTQPGFFSIGNMSQPYPKCCPQRIKKDISNS